MLLRNDCCGRLLPLRFVRCERELDYKGRAAFRPVKTLNSAAVFLNDPIADAQPQPRPLADRLRREKWIEHLMRRLDAGA
jgi:hypothetical protein